MVAPPCVLPDALRKDFSRHVRRAARGWSGRDVSEIVGRHGVMPLVADVSGLLALRADGTVVEIAWRAPELQAPVADVRTRDIALLHGARRHAPLRVLCPERGEDDADCPRCGGMGAFEPSMPSIACFCAGLGFLPAAWDEPEDDEAEPPRPVVSRRAVAAVAPGSAERGETRPSAPAPPSEPPPSEPPPQAHEARISSRVPVAPRGDREERRSVAPAASLPAPLLAVLGMLVSMGGGIGGLALAASHDLQSLGLALSCALGMLPGVLLAAWVTTR
jgi:hypothetical protein